MKNSDVPQISANTYNILSRRREPDSLEPTSNIRDQVDLQQGNQLTIDPNLNLVMYGPQGQQTHNKSHIGRVSSGPKTEPSGEETLTEAMDLLHRGRAHLQKELLQINKKDQVVLFIGNTGAGKSTLINYLGNIKLTAKATATAEQFIIEAESPIVKIGNSATQSETSIPQLWRDKSSDLVYCDLPGFGDSRGLGQEVANACLIKELTEKAGNIKIAIVVGFSELQATSGRGQGFIQCINQLERLTKSSELAEIISIIVTRVPERLNKHKIECTLGSIANNIADKNRIVQNIIKNIKGRVAVFNKPIQEGMLPDCNKEEIVTLLKSATSLNSDKARIEIPLSNNEISAVKNLVVECNRGINFKIKSMVRMLNEKYKSIIPEFRAYPEDIEELGKLHKRITNLGDAIINFISIENFIEKINKEGQALGVDISFIGLGQKTEKLNFLSTLCQGENFEDKDQWLSEVSSILEMLPKMITERISELSNEMEAQKFRKQKTEEEVKLKSTQATSTPSYAKYTYTNHTSTVVSSSSSRIPEIPAAAKVDSLPLTNSNSKKESEVNVAGVIAGSIVATVGSVAGTIAVVASAPVWIPIVATGGMVVGIAVAAVSSITKENDKQ